MLRIWATCLIYPFFWVTKPWRLYHEHTPSRRSGQVGLLPAFATWLTLDVHGWAGYSLQRISLVVFISATLTFYVFTDFYFLVCKDFVPSVAANFRSFICHEPYVRYCFQNGNIELAGTILLFDFLRKSVILLGFVLSGKPRSCHCRLEFVRISSFRWKWASASPKATSPSSKLVLNMPVKYSCRECIISIL